MSEIEGLIKAQNAVFILIQEQMTMIAWALAPAEPKFRRPLKDYWGFDWASIGAAVVKNDNKGPAIVEWCGHYFSRRSASESKYKEAIWFSRGIGDNEYYELIRFRDIDDPEPLKVKPPKGAMPIATDKLPTIFSTQAAAVQWAMDLHGIPAKDENRKRIAAKYKKMRDGLKTDDEEKIAKAWVNQVTKGSK